MRSNTFRWALVVSGVLAVFVISLFGFIYWKTDHYLVARSDKMIASQINFIAELTGNRQLDAIGQDVAQDSRDVHYAATIRRGRPEDWQAISNISRPNFRASDSVQSVSVTRLLRPAGRYM